MWLFISRHSIISESNAPVFEPSQSRSLSELELFRQKCNLPEDGEFYTAIGPDGKPRALISKKHLQKHLPMRQWIGVMWFSTLFLYNLVLLNKIIDCDFWSRS